jgi:hypothetical protein
MFAVIGLFVGVFTTFYSGVGGAYSKSYDNDTMNSFERFSELEQTSKDINTSITKVTQGSVVDVVGGLLQSGYTVLKTTWSGFTLYTEIADDGINEGMRGVNSVNYFKTAAYLIGFLLFIFAIISVLTGRDDV